MKFFDMYNKEAKKSSQNSQGIEDLDITIQCQITLFRWLMKYIRNKSDVSKINYKNVHQILISADFLLMHELVDSCLNYIRDNLTEIVEKSDSIPTYKSHIAKKLAHKIDILDLDKIEESKNLLISRLYKKKLEIFFEDTENLLNHCVICDELFTNKQAQYLICPDADSRQFIRVDGRLGCEHVADTQWDLNEYVMLLREQKHVWKEIYWKMWSLTQLFKCQECGEFFRGFDIVQCKYHPLQSKNIPGSTGAKKFLCCGKEILSLDKFRGENTDAKGCKTKSHTIDTTFQSEWTDLELFEEKLEEIRRKSNKQGTGVSTAENVFNLDVPMKAYLVKKKHTNR